MPTEPKRNRKATNPAEGEAGQQPKQGPGGEKATELGAGTQYSEPTPTAASRRAGSDEKTPQTGSRPAPEAAEAAGKGGAAGETPPAEALRDPGRAPAPPARRTPPVVRWQANMIVVLTALAPAALGALYFYGWRALVVLVVTNVFAFATEYYFTRQRKEPVTSAVFVTGSLLALSLPPRIPFWMCAVGAVVAVAFGKEMFGGMGRNVFNPALVGRAFLYVCFPVATTSNWAPPFVGGVAGLVHWMPPDGVTTATPLAGFADGVSPPLFQLFLGAIPGSLGEACKAVLILGAVYMVWKRAASWEIITSTVAAYLVSTCLFRLLGWGAGPDPIHGVLAGGFLYGAIYMATDPVSANRTRRGRVVYGAIIGLATALIRDFGNFPEGIMFAILLGNTLGPISEQVLETWKERHSGEAAS